MANAVRAAWKANRHWMAAGFLTSTCLFLLLMFGLVRNERRAIEHSKATGLSAVAPTWDLQSRWSDGSLLPVSFSRPRSTSVDYARVVVGGVSTKPSTLAVSPESPSAKDLADRMVIRTATLDILATNPQFATDQLRTLATRLSGFVVSSRVSGSDARTQSAQVIIRIPSDRFDQSRAQVRALAQSVQQDLVDARDITREYGDQEAILRNARAEEQQYLLILKRASSVQDVLDVTAKLAEIRTRIDQLQTALNSLRNEVEMSLLTVNVSTVTDAQVFGIHWRPLYAAKVSLRDALSSLAGYIDSMLGFLMNIPLIVLWGFTIVALLKLAWLALRRLLLLFFPFLGRWLHRPIPELTSSPTLPLGTSSSI